MAYEIELFSAVFAIAVSLVGYAIRNEHRLTEIETKIAPFWELLRTNLPNMLKVMSNPTPLPEPSPEKMTVEQLKDLRGRLKEQLNNSPLRTDVLLALYGIDTFLKKGQNGHNKPLRERLSKFISL